MDGTPNRLDDPEIPEEAVSFAFVRARGAGGQHVNKAATAVQLRLQLERTRLPEPVRERLRRLAGNRLTGIDEIVIFADEHRSQARNRKAALDRLADLIAAARRSPTPRRPTRPSRGQKQARLDAKRRQGQTKKLRGKPDPAG